jgi:hypothetical protein
MLIRFPLCNLPQSQTRVAPQPIFDVPLLRFNVTPRQAISGFDWYKNSQLKHTEIISTLISTTMRFNLLSTAAFASLATTVLAQANFCPEAARFGLLNVSPTTLSPGQVNLFRFNFSAV